MRLRKNCDQLLYWFETLQIIKAVHGFTCPLLQITAFWIKP